MPIPLLLTLSEAADALRVDVRTLRREIDEGSLSAVYVRGRILIRERVVMNYIEANEGLRRPRRAA
jgi:excisionase family DNA binding protein